MSGYLHHLKRAVPAGVLAGAMLAGQAVRAQDMTAKVVLDRMSSDQLSGYLAGIVEGLAYARYVKDGNTTAGMGCVYRWYYDTPDTLRNIYSTFDRFPDHLPGAVMAAMIAKACP